MFGYAHMGQWFNVRRGLALDMPFGIVDFLEMMQMGRLLTDAWYSFLNLGYKLSPAAGSDFPYIDLPGVVRNYVKVKDSASADEWLSSFRAGHIHTPLVQRIPEMAPSRSPFRCSGFRQGRAGIGVGADLA